ncbi:pur operon repressor [Thermoanaerobacterium sp. RBIITD]|uniref:pur operon repressor n=1 Tax=Thermoanaerobacterium sp. RBIITD TaxID=1550240 RepID=UPI000BB8F136|nr:pur operon repressor [Thermoanaerobacterium sp. RBIITD]SNX53926.1 purine operon repressor, PurR [Thermoanaerobacterium sp. RBIITD]
MNIYKRYERISVILKILSENPNTLFNLNYFMDLFKTAKSTASEDIEILKSTLKKFGFGEIKTVAGAGGGIKYIPINSIDSYHEFMIDICKKLEDPKRIIPGGFLYTADIIYSPSAANKIGEILSHPFQEKEVDAVVTVETKGIPIALMCARSLNVPLVIIRQDNRVTEGSSVSINYVSGSKMQIRAMSLSRRSLERNSKVVLIDDFMKAGGTIKGMMELMNEFDAEVLGAGVMIATKEPEVKVVKNYFSLFTLVEMDEEKNLIEMEISDWLK